MKTHITVALTMNVDTVSQLMAALKALGDREVLVGVPEDKDARSDGDGINNATLAAVQNFGSPAQGIPAREFMESGVESVEERVTDMLRQTGAKALDGDVSAVDKGLNSVGLIASNGIKNKIVTGPFKELKRATIMARRRAGFKGTKPLNRSGQLKNAITYVLRKRVK